MDNILAVLYMSGYAAYVWSAVVLALVVLTANVWSAWRGLQLIRNKIQRNNLGLNP